MIKFKQGWLGSMDGEKTDIIVKAAAPNKLRDILIGGGITLAGISYLTYTAFRHGSECFEKAEFRTMTDLGIVDSQ